MKKITKGLNGRFCNQCNQECRGCEWEMESCYLWQKDGYDAGLKWSKEGHCFVFVLDKDGGFIIK